MSDEGARQMPGSEWARVAELPRSAVPAGRGVIRLAPGDFVVEEIPVQEPDGRGEHLWLWVEKQGENTEWVAGQLARAFGVKPVAVGYAGRKDRHALTRQWFSVHCPVPADPQSVDFGGAQARVLRAVRHGRKLRVGGLRGNRFELRVRDLEGEAEALQRRLGAIADQGVPNYFGEQRFGMQGRNLASAYRLFAGQGERDRKRRGLFLSAARAALFNGILARRVNQGSWNRLVPGEAVMLNGSNSFFVAETIDAPLERRLEAHDVHPSGALWGKGELACRGAARRLETAVAESAPALAQGLTAAGLRQERRALRLCPTQMSWTLEEAERSLRVAFVLPAGAFATAVLRELLEYRDGSAAAHGPDR